MTKTNKYVFITLRVRSGDYDFESKGVHKISSKIDAIDFAEKYASDFYGDKSHEDNGRYYFNGGEVAVDVRRAQEITKEEYDAMSRFL
ncbi:MAG TPA: hypothetical protein VJY62_15060 [Bacteroidia bacterium]|nr:hypothetical protein [Bacteroidia bacterium]